MKSACLTTSPMDAHSLSQPVEPKPTPSEDGTPWQGGSWQVSMRVRRAGRANAFTLLEGLIASVIVAMVAATASMSVAVGVAIEQQNRLSVLAMQAAELQMGSVLEESYDNMGSLSGTEAMGTLLGPKQPGSNLRSALPGAFSELSRSTTVTTENRTFTQFNNYTLTGKVVQVIVTGANGVELARLVRFRGKDPTT